jgi:hypothetical protein
LLGLNEKVYHARGETVKRKKGRLFYKNKYSVYSIKLKPPAKNT